jgi:hypothetical protein
VFLSFLIALQGPASVPADPRPVYDGRARALTAVIPRLDAKITIDGNLDEPAWSQAALLTGFSQYTPVDGLPAADSTQVLVWYGPDAIYFGIRAYEPHGNVVRATMADRDAIDADDNVQILLDTYHDHRRALEFAVNPLGIQEDGVRSEGLAGAAGGGNAATGRFDGVIDLNPDFVWESRGHLTPYGFEVEVRIPFKSIRYQSLDPQDWGLQVIRNVTHSGYQDTWTPVVRASASFLIQAGTIAGLHDLHRGLVMDVTPEFTTKVEGDSAGAGRYLYHGTPEIGGTLHWGLTSNLSLAATAHPDFSQVEADAAQVTVNQRFALFYPEKRPFFLDGLEQYDTPNQLIYTRQIIQPVAGAKLTGKAGGTNIAYLGAVDAVDPATGQNPVYNVMRVSTDLGASSTVGVAYTDRIEGADYNRVFGADSRVLWGTGWFSQAQIAGSWTRDGVGVRSGTLWDATLGDYTGRSYGNHFEFIGITPDFQAASGFVNRTGIVSARLFNRFTWYGKPGAAMEQLQTIVMGTPLWRYDDFWHARGTIEGGWANTWGLTLRGGWNLSAAVSDNLQRFDSATYGGYRVDRGVDTIAFRIPHGLYNLLAGNASVTSPNRALQWSASIGYGHSVIFAEAAEGKELTAQASLSWKPTSSIRVSATWLHDRLVRERDGSEFALANIPRLEFDYQLNRSVFVRYIGQYVAQRQSALQDPRTGQPLLVNSAAVVGTLSNGFRNDFLLSYKPTPGTVFFLGYGTSLTEPTAFAFSTTNLTRTQDGFFLKASYLFRM